MRFEASAMLLRALGRGAPRLIEPSVSCLEFAGSRVTLALRFRGSAGEFRVLAVRPAELSLEMLDPPSQELPLLGNASKLLLGSLNRAASSFHVGFGCLHCLGSAACGVRLGPGANSLSVRNRRTGLARSARSALPARHRLGGRKRQRRSQVDLTEAGVGQRLRQAPGLHGSPCR